VRRSGWWRLLALSVGLWLTVAQPLDAASFALTPVQREEAIRVGKRSILHEEFGAEWKVDGGGSGRTVVVMTLFHRLALAARNSAFKSQDLRPRDIEALLKEQEGALTLWVTVSGGKPDFARSYSSVLVGGQHEIKAAFAQNERTAWREDDGTYTARCMYVFPTDKLDSKETVALIVRDSDNKQVAKFTLDLAAMR